MARLAIPQRIFVCCLTIFATTAMVVLFGCSQSEFTGINVSSLPVSGFSKKRSESISIRNADEDEDQQDARSKKFPNPKDLVSDWEKPLFALFVSGRQHGYIEPCGCTSLAIQKGGLMRRHSAQKVLLDRNWDLISIDSGNQIDRFGHQPQIKLRHTYESLIKTMGYNIVGLGVDDLKTPTIDLIQIMANLADDPSELFVAANVDVMGAGMQSPYRVVEKNGRRIAITYVLGNEHLEKIKGNSDLTLSTAEQGLQAVVPGIQSEKCQMNILVAQTDLDSCRKLAKQFPIFDMLITSGGSGDPTLMPEVIETSKKQTRMIQVGAKGNYVGIVGYYENAGKPSLKYERVPLDARFRDSAEMREMFLKYQDELKQLYLAGELRDVKPRPHPSGYKFVGSETCNDCHDEEYEIWEDGVGGDGGPHFRATLDLTEPEPDDGFARVWLQRHYDPECLSCHVTGWNPQGYYPYESGFRTLAKDAHLTASGCENCHGPGSAHVEAENDGADEKVLEKLRLEMRLTLKEAKEDHCMQCHDLDNSPGFAADGAFERYWEKIKH